MKRRTKRAWKRRIRRFRQSHVPLVIGATAGALLLGAAAATAVMYDPEPPDSTPVANAPAFTTGLGVQPEVEPYVPTLADAMSRLANKDRPFNILILGDSTSVEPVIGWHPQLMDWLAAQTDRPWTMNQWVDGAPGSAAYAENALSGGEGDGAPIVLWNGSVGGKNFDYVRAYLADMVPRGMPVDLLIVNEGHNVYPERDYYNSGIPLIDQIHKRLPDAAIVMTAQNPEKGDVAAHHSMASIVDMVDVYAAQHELPVIDVYSAFEKTGHPDALLDVAMKHPTPEGYRIWFQAAKDVLEPALP